MAEALGNLSVEIERSGVEVLTDPLPRIRFERVKFLQLIQNLVGNAVKFRADANPRISITAAIGPAELVLSVADNGIGIEPAYRDKIFEVFQRLHNGARYPGTGIGLAICKRVVEQRRGRIWVETTPGGGSTFRIALPAQLVVTP